MTPHVVVVGGADTGRAPITAALLCRALMRRGLAWQVESAGLLGHDGAEAQLEARAAATDLGFNLDQHVARSLDEATLAADLLVAVDSGLARAMRSQFPEQAARVASLGELARSSRDIPDPFRMQIGAWIVYAREIQRQVDAALDAIIARVSMPPASTPASVAPPVRPEPALAARQAEVQRLVDLLERAAACPELIDWRAVTARIAAAEHRLAAPVTPGDLAGAYLAVLRQALDRPPVPVRTVHLQTLATALRTLAAPVEAASLASLSTQLAGWEHLA